LFTGIYRYGGWGVNWRALVALIVAITPNLPVRTSTFPGPLFSKPKTYASHLTTTPAYRE
jgi:cytosine/uracil/thiamine/allantoin permease